MSTRGIGRISAIGLLVAGTVGLVAAPASAANTDFAVNLTGASLAAGAVGKVATLTITNHGSSTPDALDVRLDSSGLDDAKVTMVVPVRGCRVDDGVTTCRLQDEEIPAPGRSLKLPVLMERVTGAGGAAGELTVTVAAAGDTDRADNSKTVDVTVADSKVDLSVHADDVSAADDLGLPTGRPVAPGAVGVLFAGVINQGATIAAGIRIDVVLPEHSTIAGPVDGCEQSPDKRSLTCVLDDVTLLPFSAEEGLEQAVLIFDVPVRVARDAAGPVTLPDGVITAVALGHDTRVARRTTVADELPENFSRPDAAELAAIDADSTDNIDRFAVLVAGPAGAGAGTGQAGGAQVDGAQDDDVTVAGGQAGGGQAGGASVAGLPVTGPALSLIGGGGFALAVAGVLMYLAARRRRVRLVAPDDGA